MVLIRDGDSAIDVATCNTVQMRELRRECVAIGVPSNSVCCPWRTVRRNVGFGLELRGETPHDARPSSMKIGTGRLSQWAERYVSELSGGMQQRSLGSEPLPRMRNILLMDEPVFGVGSVISRQVAGRTAGAGRRASRRRSSSSGHDMDEALRLGDTFPFYRTPVHSDRYREDIVLGRRDDYVAEFVRHMNPLTVLTGG